MWQYHPATNTEGGRDSSYKRSAVNNIYSKTQQEEVGPSFGGLKPRPRHTIDPEPAGASSQQLSDLRLLIDDHRTLGELHQRPVQHEDDLPDAGDAADECAPHLDVESRVACFTLHGNNMVAGGRKLIEKSIKGLPVIIPPSCAHLVDEGSVSYNDSSINRLERSDTREEWSKSPTFT